MGSGNELQRQNNGPWSLGERHRYTPWATKGRKGVGMLGKKRKRNRVQSLCLKGFYLEVSGGGSQLSISFLGVSLQGCSFHWLVGARAGGQSVQLVLTSAMASLHPVFQGCGQWGCSGAETQLRPRCYL